MASLTQTFGAQFPASTPFWPVPLDNIFGSSDPVFQFLMVYTSSSQTDSCTKPFDDFSLFCPAACTNSTTVFSSSAPVDLPLWSCIIWPDALERIIQDPASLSGSGIDVETLLQGLEVNAGETAYTVSDVVASGLSSYCDRLFGCADETGTSVCAQELIDDNTTMLDFSGLSTCMSAICTPPKGFTEDSAIAGAGVWASSLLQFGLVVLVAPVMMLLRAYLNRNKYQKPRQHDYERALLPKFIDTRSVWMAQIFSLWTLLVAGNIAIHLSQTPWFERTVLIVATNLQCVYMLVVLLVLIRLWVCRDTQDPDKGKKSKEVEGLIAMVIGGLSLLGAIIWLIIEVVRRPSNMDGTILAYRNEHHQLDWPSETGFMSPNLMCDAFDIHKADFIRFQEYFVFLGGVLFLILAMLLFFRERKWLFIIYLGLVCLAACGYFAFVMWMSATAGLVSWNMNYGQVATILVWPFAFAYMILNGILEWWRTRRDSMPRSQTANQWHGQGNYESLPTTPGVDASYNQSFYPGDGPSSINLADLHGSRPFATGGEYDRLHNVYGGR